jgi:hypothetical protein
MSGQPLLLLATYRFYEERVIVARDATMAM